MKVLILCVLLVQILVPLSGTGQQEAFTFQSSWTLRELAEANRIPLGKLAPALKMDALKDAGTVLQQLEVEHAEARTAIEKYRAGESAFVRNIVGIGMLIVFSSLILVAVLISLLRHLSFGENNRSERKTARSVVGTIRTSGDLSSYALAAVVAAIFLHEEEVEQENRLLLTYKRASTNMWRAARTMPNDAYQNNQGGWK